MEKEEAVAQPRPLEIFFLPYIFTSHLIPLSEMARLFSSRGEQVTIITTTTHVTAIQNAVDKDIASGHPISLKTLPFPFKEVGLPENLENDSSTDKLDHAASLYRGMILMQPTIEDFILKHRPDCIVSDAFFPWTADLAARLSIPRLVFDGYCIFAKTLHEALLNPSSPHRTVKSDYDQFVIPNLPHSITMTRSQLPNSYIIQLLEEWRKAELKSYAVLVNGFSELDSVYTDHYSKIMGHKVFHIGPASLIHKNTSDKVERSYKTVVSEQDCLGWLNLKTPNSVLYVCFGSGCEFPDAQLMEIACALDASGSDFIWVVAGKEANEEKENTEKWLPKGFEEKIQEKGMIVKGWAPQLLILDHPAVGGFLTHCGWNSVVEGASAGIPMVTWPLYAEQFLNEKLLTRVLGIGVEVGAEDWNMWVDVGKKVIKREKIENAVRKLMDGGDLEAMEMRRKAKELGEMARKAIKESGSSHNNLIVLIEELKHARDTRLTKGNHSV